MGPKTLNKRCQDLCAKRQICVHKFDLDISELSLKRNSKWKRVRLGAAIFTMCKMYSLDSLIKWKRAIRYVAMVTSCRKREWDSFSPHIYDQQLPRQCETATSISSMAGSLCCRKWSGSQWYGSWRLQVRDCPHRTIWRHCFKYWSYEAVIKWVSTPNRSLKIRNRRIPIQNENKTVLSIVYFSETQTLLGPVDVKPLYGVS